MFWGAVQKFIAKNTKFPSVIKRANAITDIGKLYQLCALPQANDVG